MKVLVSLSFAVLVSAVDESYDWSGNKYNEPTGAQHNYNYGLEPANDAYGGGYGVHGGGNFGNRGYGGKMGYRGVGYGGYNGVYGQYGRYKGGGGNPLVAEAIYRGPYQKVSGGRFGLGYGGIKSPLAPIVNSAYQGNFGPMKKFGFGGFGGHNNYAAGEINDYLIKTGRMPVDPDDLDGDNVPDFLTATKHKIDNYIAKQWLLGRRKLTVNVNYANMPLEYMYLSQYHGFPNPVAGTPLGKRFGLTTKKNDYNNPKTAGAYSKSNYKKPLKPMKKPLTPPPKKPDYGVMTDEKPSGPPSPPPKQPQQQYKPSPMPQHQYGAPPQQQYGSHGSQPAQQQYGSQPAQQQGYKPSPQPQQYNPPQQQHFKPGQQMRMPPPGQFGGNGGMRPMEQNAGGQGAPGGGQNGQGSSPPNKDSFGPPPMQNKDSVTTRRK